MKKFIIILVCMLNLQNLSAEESTTDISLVQEKSLFSISPAFAIEAGTYGFGLDLHYAHNSYLFGCSYYTGTELDIGFGGNLMNFSIDMGTLYSFEKIDKKAYVQSFERDIYDAKRLDLFLLKFGKCWYESHAWQHRLYLQLGGAKYNYGYVFSDALLRAKNALAWGFAYDIAYNFGNLGIQLHTSLLIVDMKPSFGISLSTPLSFVSYKGAE